jgi:hypothetical protein
MAGNSLQAQGNNSTGPSCAAACHCVVRYDAEYPEAAVLKAWKTIVLRYVLRQGGAALSSLVCKGATHTHCL